ncbi:MAG: glycoside hydrolase family 25 protein [Flavobacterium sp.]|nr:glycoside hydrolase family 25 protein [Flavobacterium sp.]
MQKRKRKLVRKSKPSAGFKYRKPLWIAIAILFLFGIGYHYRNGLAYYFSFKSDKILREEKRLADIRNLEVIHSHPALVVGIDVSEYQGTINWTDVDSIAGRPIGFAFIRATAGRDKIDRRFNRNWESAKQANMLRGAYHYYRPDENSLEQAQNFITAVKLKNGDLPPVLDIEQISKVQSVDSLKRGLRKWLVAVEKHYNVRPIIYSGERYYTDFLQEEFKDYVFWIANYNFFVESIKPGWTFWQFTEKGSVPGIQGPVDVNLYNGTPKMLGYLTIINAE